MATTPSWKVSKVQPAEEEGYRVEPDGDTGPELWFNNGLLLALTHTLGVFLVCFKLIGCMRGRYHYRMCTSKTVQDPSDLWCPFCMYSEQLWQQARKRIIPACELAFMRLLMAWGIDTNFACQVVPRFWKAPMDFFNMVDRYYVQIDGRCHWVGIHQLSSTMIIARDMLQNVAAAGARACVVRVHMADISSAACIGAALQAAVTGGCFVLTPAYATTLVQHGPLLITYVQLLLQLVPNCYCVTDSYGNSIIYRM